MLGDQYRILELLGEGGMGRVYRAEHVYLRRQVALKLLRHDSDRRAETIARFEQEARAASRVGHPSIVEVIDFARLPDGNVFLVMEWLRGQSLEDWMETRGHLGPALRWMVDVARGLDAAHAAGVIHRDVKPANIFLQHGEDGGITPKILDFGIAKLTRAEGEGVETEAGTLLGTPYYLAPERAMGKALDPRADLYSLGVILYELLTGNVPFVDKTFMGVLALHIKAAPLDPRQAAPDREIPDGIARLTMELLSKNPDDRPPNGEAVAVGIEACLAADGPGLDALEIGPPMSVRPSELTLRMDDVADRPTTAPDDNKLAPTSDGGTTRMEGPMVSFAGAPAIRTHFETSFEPVRSAPRAPWVWGIPLMLVLVAAVAAGAAFLAWPDSPVPATRVDPPASFPPPAPLVAVPDSESPAPAAPVPPEATQPADPPADPRPEPAVVPPSGSAAENGTTAPDGSGSRKKKRARKNKKKPTDANLPQLKDDIY